MASVHDVAAAILEQAGPMTAMKLEKLTYYAQAVALATTDEPLFAERIEAWRNGPVVPALYREHRGRYRVSEWAGTPGALTEREMGIVRRTIDLYGGRDADWLSSQSHVDEPWRRARGDRHPTERSNNSIDLEVMRRFYGMVLDDSLVECALDDPPAPTEFLDGDELRARLSGHLSR